MRLATILTIAALALPSERICRYHFSAGPRRPGHGGQFVLPERECGYGQWREHLGIPVRHPVRPGCAAIRRCQGRNVSAGRRPGFRYAGVGSLHAGRRGDHGNLQCPFGRRTRCERFRLAGTGTVPGSGARQPATFLSPLNTILLDSALDQLGTVTEAGIQVTVNAAAPGVPEPGTFTLLGLGLAAAGLWRVRRARR